jgi:uncharacterized glyoxalase superfamily protein PhnB
VKKKKLKRKKNEKSKARRSARTRGAKARATARKAARRPQPVPAGYGTVTPCIVCDEAGKAIEFYKQAFGAKQRVLMPGADGRVMHAEIQIGTSRVMLCDEMPAMGTRSPRSLGGSPASLFLYVKNVDAAFARATAAGASVVMPVQDMFWGDRYGKLKDPFGHEWQIATHKEDLTPRQIAERAKAAMPPG